MIGFREGLQNGPSDLDTTVYDAAKHDELNVKQTQKST